MTSENSPVLRHNVPAEVLVYSQKLQRELTQGASELIQQIHENYLNVRAEELGKAYNS